MYGKNLITALLITWISVMKAHFFWPAVLDPQFISVFLQNKENSCSSCNAIIIQDKPVKHIIDLNSLPLSYIFNLCLSNGEFACRTRLIKISVLYKERYIYNLGNCIPILILPVSLRLLKRFFSADLWISRINVT